MLLAEYLLACNTQTSQNICIPLYKFLFFFLRIGKEQGLYKKKNCIYIHKIKYKF